jgi:hypothetical protein
MLKFCKGLFPRGGVVRDGLDSRGNSSLGIAALKLNVMLLLIGEMVLSGDNVMRCVRGRTGEEGESRLMDFARVSAISRRACSRRRCWRSF